MCHYILILGTQQCPIYAVPIPDFQISVNLALHTTVCDKFQSIWLYIQRFVTHFSQFGSTYNGCDKFQSIWLYIQRFVTNSSQFGSTYNGLWQMHWLTLKWLWVLGQLYPIYEVVLYLSSNCSPMRIAGHLRQMHRFIFVPELPLTLNSIRGTPNIYHQLVGLIVLWLAVFKMQDCWKSSHSYPYHDISYLCHVTSFSYHFILCYIYHMISRHTTWILHLIHITPYHIYITSFHIYITTSHWH